MARRTSRGPSRRRLLRHVCALLACLGALLPAEASAQARRPVVVVELFTAQGCAACPDANLRLAALAEQDGVLLLTWSVDYWDYLGWRDTLARPEAADRQRAYVRRLALRRPSTPQVIVAGAETADGRNLEQLTAVVENAPVGGVDLRLAADGSRVWVGSGRASRGGGDVWLIRYEPEPEAVRVADGENRGREVRVVNAVRSVERLGAWNGRPAVWRLPPGDEALRTAVLLQEADGGRVLGQVAEPEP